MGDKAIRTRFLIIFLTLLVSFSYCFAAPPSFITITSPSDGSYVSKSVTIEAQLNQTPKAKSVKFYIDNNLVGEDTTSPYQYTWNTTSYSDGQHTLYASILQAPERSGQKIPPVLESPKITVTVDNSPPTVPIVSDDGIYTNSNNKLHSSWTSSADPQSGIKEYQYAIGTVKGATDLVSWSSNGLSLDVTRTGLSLTEGQAYYITVKAINGVNLSSVGYSDGIIVDSIAPQISITSPQNGSVSTTQTITVSGTIDDNQASVSVNGSPATVSNGTFSCSGITLTQGQNTIAVTAIDLAGNTSSASITVTYQPNSSGDTTPPSINIYTPDNNSTTRSNIVYGRVSDDAVRVTVNDIDAELSNSIFIARPPLTEGQNTVTVKAWDAAGNLGESQISFVYNTATPKVTITSPLNNSTQNVSPITVQGTNTADLSFIMVNSATGFINNTNFTAEGVILNSAKTVITATGYDANNNKFSDSIVVNSPNLANYELSKISGDATEVDPNRPSAGSSQILKVKLEKNGLAAPNEEVQFKTIQGSGSLSSGSSFTDINGEAQVTLTTDTNSDMTNQVECYPTSNPLVKITFSIDTKPAAPSILTKITDDSITPVPSVTIPLIVKLTDLNNNPIQDETINFQVIQGIGTISSPTAVTTSYGEAKVNLTCPNLGLVLTQVQASSQTVPSVTATFNITTSAILPVTVDDVIAKVNLNDSKIQDVKADITVTSNAPSLAPVTQLKIWIKGNKQKVEEISPIPGVYIRPVIEGSIMEMDKQIISSDPVLNVYVVRIKKEGQTDEYPYIVHYIDYEKGVNLKTEYHILQNGFETTSVSEYSDLIQIGDAWGYQRRIDKMYMGDRELIYITTNVYSNIQINTGIPDSEFQ